MDNRARGTQNELASLGCFRSALLLLLLLVADTTHARTPYSHDEDCSDPLASTATHFNTTLCKDKCENDCHSYITPLNQCYNAASLFPDDPSFSDHGILDSVICQTLSRTIFEHSSNSTCQQSVEDDHFIIPLSTCVGPFGAPRPWGTFELVDIEEGKENIATTD